MTVASERRPYARSAVRRIGAAAGIGVALLLATGCAVGKDAPTDFEGGPGNGANTATGGQLGRGLVLVMDEDGSASLAGSLLNMTNDDEALTSVTVGDTAAKITKDGVAVAQVAVPARTSLRIGGPDTPLVTATGLKAPIGQFVRVTLQYGTSGATTTDVLTVPGTGIWADLVASTG